MNTKMYKAKKAAIVTTQNTYSMARPQYDLTKTQQYERTEATKMEIFSSVSDNSVKAHKRLLLCASYTKTEQFERVTDIYKNEEI